MDLKTRLKIIVTQIHLLTTDLKTTQTISVTLKTPLIHLRKKTKGHSKRRPTGIDQGKKTKDHITTLPMTRTTQILLLVDGINQEKKTKDHITT